MKHKYLFIFVIFSLFLKFNLFGQSNSSVNFVQSLQDKLEAGDINGAISLYDSIPSSLSGDVDLQFLKVSLLISAERYDEALAITSKYTESEDASIKISALELNAEIYKASKKRTELSNTLKALIQADPNNPTANVIYGNQQALSKKYKLAANYYKKALLGDSSNLDAIFGYGQMCYFTGDLKTSKTMLTKLVKMDSQNAQAYSYLGKLAAEEENYMQAENFIQKAIEIEPENYEFYIDLGQYNRSRGKYADAENAWTQAINLNPDYFLPYTYRAGLYDEQNQIEKALADYHKVVEKNPKYYFAYEEIGILEFYMKNWSEARKYFMKANEVNKSAAYQLMVMATWIKENKLFEAKNFAQTCMKTLDRNSIEYLMIRLYHDQGPLNSEYAIAKKIESETDKNKKGKFKYYLALYYEMKGSEKVANEYYSQVVEMDTPMFFEYRLAEWGIKK